MEIPELEIWFTSDAAGGDGPRRPTQGRRGASCSDRSRRAPTRRPASGATHRTAGTGAGRRSSAQLGALAPAFGPEGAEAAPLTGFLDGLDPALAPMIVDIGKVALGAGIAAVPSLLVARIGRVCPDEVEAEVDGVKVRL